MMIIISSSRGSSSSSICIIVFLFPLFFKYFKILGLWILIFGGKQK